VYLHTLKVPVMYLHATNDDGSNDNDIRASIYKPFKQSDRVSAIQVPAGGGSGGGGNQLPLRINVAFGNQPFHVMS
jgi:hypothetical protein